MQNPASFLKKSLIQQLPVICYPWYSYSTIPKVLAEPLLTDMHRKFNIEITELCLMLQGYKGQLKASQNGKNTGGQEDENTVITDDPT